MKATEVRLGNIVLESILKKPKIITIDDFLFHHDGVKRFNVEWSSIEPIPLTKEWLVRLGVEKFDGYIVKNEDESFRFEVNGIFDSIIIVSKIQYIHELQNLFFALTGEELEIKY